MTAWRLIGILAGLCGLALALGCRSGGEAPLPAQARGQPDLYVEACVI